MTTSKERPIIFSGEMVCAIVEGRKTQTRRVMKPQPFPNFNWVVRGKGVMANSLEGFSAKMVKHCRYGQVGARLWVRETWAAISPDEYRRPLAECDIEYKADTPNAKYPGGWPEEEAKGNDDAPKWRSPIHMPRWASRLTLEITEVRVGRVQDISQIDAMKEGTQGKHSFAVLWDNINAQRGHSWESNPWVWVIEFKHIAQESEKA